MLRRLALPVFAVLLLGLLVACGDDGATATKKTPDAYATSETTPPAGETPATETPTSGGEETPQMSFAQACQKSDQQQFSQPEQIIDTSKTYVATITTAKGDIVVELFSDVPITTNSFVFLACKGFYDGLTFHRVEPGFVAQGGDPEGTGSGGPGYTIPGEFDGSSFDAGVLGMARTDEPDSAGSQFFITLAPAHHLDGQYAAFGRVTAGMEVAQQIAIGDVIETISIEER